LVCFVNYFIFVLSLLITLKKRNKMENTERQQFDLIAEMINTARREFNNNSFIYLLWGWSVCIASLVQYVLLMVQSPYNGIAWAILMPLALVAQLVYMVRSKKKERVKTHMDRIMDYVWIAVGVSLGIVLFSQVAMQLNTFPVLILLYGIGTFISGGIMNQKVMMAGAICCWVIAIIAFYVKFEYQLLLLSLSLVLAYIIPGHILMKRFRQHV
jgi:hypothetical protein